MIFPSISEKLIKLPKTIVKCKIDLEIKKKDQKCN